jgi:hypothetical protein
MRALGRGELPATILLSGVEYHLVRTVKHDFFAATGFYDDAAGRRVVLKVGRTQEFAGIPLLWVGKLSCRRELRFHRKLQDIEQVPRVLGTLGETGFVMDYVAGHRLCDVPRVPDGFFRELQDLMETLHDRDIAYCDANKTQNILVGTDGRPHLIDFQISGDLETLGRGWLGRRILAQLQWEDAYHVLKHKSRLRPDELMQDERRRADRKSFVLRAHRFLLKPYFKIRRHTFHRLRESGRLLPEGSK